MITLENILSDEFVTKFYNEKIEILNNFYDNIESLDDILSNKKHKGNFFLKILNEIYSIYRSREQKKVNYYKIDFTGLEKYFSKEAVEWIIIYNDDYINSDILRAYSSYNCNLELIEAIRLSAWQAYCDSLEDKSEIEYIYHKMNKPNNFTDDDRFSVLGVYTNAYQRGYVCSLSTKNKKGAIVKYYDEETNKVVTERTTSAYRSIMLDAKLGFIIYFKNIPSMTVSFNIDSNKNLYIHQIQAQIKDRGHYKIKGNWKTEILNYITNTFPDYKIHLISGENIAKIVEKSYSKDAHAEIKPSSFDLDKIKQSYDNLFSNFTKKINFSDFIYRTY